MNLDFSRLAGTAAMVVLVGCSQGSLGTAPSTASQVPSWAPSAPLNSAYHTGGSNMPGSLIGSRGKSGEPAIFVSDQGENEDVQVYAQTGRNQQPIATIAGFQSPRGLFVDRHQTLWVADNDADIVFGVLPGNTSPTLTRNDGAAPWAVAVSNNGSVYAANQQVCCVTVFAPGSSNPSMQLGAGNTGALYIQGLTIDHRGNLFGTYTGIRDGVTVIGILEYAKGASTPVDLGITLGGSYGIQIAKNGDIVVADYVYGIEAFKTGATTPYVTIPQENGGTYLQLALRSDERALYVVDAGNVCVWKIAFPSGKILDKITTGLDDGVRGVALGAW
jgi:hypothetical protein